LKLGEDADGDTPLSCGSVVCILLLRILIIAENVCIFFLGFYVLEGNAVVDCNVGDFGVGIRIIIGVAVCVHGGGGVDGVQSLSDCVVRRDITGGVDVLKMNLSLKMSNDGV